MKSRWVDGIEPAHPSSKVSLAVQVSAAGSRYYRCYFAFARVSVRGYGGRGLRVAFGEAVKQPAQHPFLAHSAAWMGRGGDVWRGQRSPARCTQRECFTSCLGVAPLPGPVWEKQNVHWGTELARGAAVMVMAPL